MGVIKEILLLPAAPVRLSLWATEKVTEEAKRQHYSAGAGVGRLQAIQRAREEGRISDERAAELEGEVLEQQVGRPQSGSPPPV